LETAQAFLESFETDSVSQLQLATALEVYAQSERDAEGSSLFLTSGYYAVPGSFRDSDEFAVPCLLDTDLEMVEPLLKSRKPYDGFIVNVPQKWAHAWLADDNTRPGWLPKYLQVVSGAPDRYLVNRGFINQAPEEVDLG
jgi:CRISPR-associated endonuclease/helicase Cas3